MTSTIPSPADLANRPPSLIDVLIWDAPNVDMTLSNIIGRRPTSATRPRYDRVARWFLADAGERVAQAVVFTNYTEGTAPTIRPWLEAVRALGFDVFIKPKLDAADDIDAAMLAHVETLQEQHRLSRLVVVSGDRRNFEEPLVRLAADGVDVTVVSFNEVASWARQAPGLTFVDLEDIPGAFLEPLGNRIRLESLPPAGAWLRATGELRANLRDLAEESRGELLAAS